MAISKRDALIGGAATLFATAGAGQATPTQPRPSAYKLANGDAVMSLLDAAPYVSFGTGDAILYELSFRACGPCIAFTRNGARRLVHEGYQVRSFVFAPKPTARRTVTAGAGEMASVAEIYRTRSADYYDAWFRSSNIDGFAATRGVADVTGNVAALDAVAQGREKIKAIGSLLEQSPAGSRWGFPAFIWRNQNAVWAKFGYGSAQNLLSAIRQG